MMDQMEKLAELARSLGCEACPNEPMNRHTTFRIGGPADLFLEVKNRRALREICRFVKDAGLSFFPIGNGSNLLVADSGIRGVVAALGGDFKTIRLCGDAALECGAGASLASVCNFAKNNALNGIEFAWGIPGSVGGAVFMNAGAYEHSMSEIVTSCFHVFPAGETGKFDHDALNFGYRRSVYSAGGYLITGTRLRLKHGDFDTIGARMEELYGRRKEKQPLEFPSAGSVFKRPEGHFAGALIEQCGLKGRRVGGAAVSGKHAGFIVNLGGATCADVRKLISDIQETVLRETGIQLECEIKMIG